MSDEIAVGIDLGTSYSCVAVVHGGQPQVVPNEWGEVTHWEPPGRLSYLWHLRRDRADATVVDIQFTAAGDGTEIEITHTGWEQLGAEGPTWRDRNQSGWTTLLPHFVRAAEPPEEET